MIAMQYSFTLPADYDMSIIDRRIRDKGPLLDGFPRLRIKAYLSARKQDAGFENLYAPFYLWDEPEGVDSFLSSPGFAAVTQDFGWPSVQTWLVWQADLGADLGNAAYATAMARPPRCARQGSKEHWPPSPHSIRQNGCWSNSHSGRHSPSRLRPCRSIVSVTSRFLIPATRGSPPGCGRLICKIRSMAFSRYLPPLITCL
jgi:hypothetical protein